VIGGNCRRSTLSLETRGVKLMAPVPQGIPPLRIPAVYWNDLTDLLPLALACFLLVRRNCRDWPDVCRQARRDDSDANQENLALAASNLFAGLGGGFPVTVVLAVARQRRGRCAHTALHRLAQSSFCSCALSLASFERLTATGPRRRGLVAIAGPAQLSTLKELWRSDRSELWWRISTRRQADV